MNSKETLKVTLVHPEEHILSTLEVSQGVPILDDAQEQGFDLPYSCRSGACFDCLAKVVEGEIEQTDTATSRLTPDELTRGYVLLCSCFATSNCTILTHQIETFFA